MKNLETIYDRTNSFYGKAKVELDENQIILYSYGPLVAFIENGIAYITGDYSQTTLRHIKEFLLQKLVQDHGQHIQFQYYHKRSFQILPGMKVSTYLPSFQLL